jgi:hypothetical protein
MKAQTPPRKVADYARAFADGVVRPVPALPPTLLPGRTANGMMRMFILSTVAWGALWFALHSAAGRISSTHAGLRGPLLFVISSGVFFGVLAQVSRVGNRNVEEFARGYTTLRLQFGLLFYTGLTFKRSPREQRTPWNYSGIWVLDDHGRVLSPPDPGVDPPGYFPSPNRPGQFELWTGACWSGHFRKLPP